MPSSNLRSKNWGVVVGVTMIFLGCLVLALGLFSTLLDAFAVVIAALNLGAGVACIALSRGDAEAEAE